MEIYFYLWIALIALFPPRHQIKAILTTMMLLALWGIAWLLADRHAVFDGQQPLRYGLTGLGIGVLGGALFAQQSTYPAFTQSPCAIRSADST